MFAQHERSLGLYITIRAGVLIGGRMKNTWISHGMPFLLWII
jgi:hypothetical protein